MNLLHLQAAGLQSVQWQRRIADDSASATWFGAVMAPDLKEVQQVVDRAKDKPSIGLVRSALDIIQMPTPQRDALRASLHEEASPIASSPPSGAATFSSQSVRRALQSLQRVRALANRQEAAAEEAGAWRAGGSDAVDPLAAEEALPAGRGRPLHTAMATTMPHVGRWLILEATSCS
jgi:hypothetical protein